MRKAILIAMLALGVLACKKDDDVVKCKTIALVFNTGDGDYIVEYEDGTRAIIDERKKVGEQICE